MNETMINRLVIHCMKITKGIIFPKITSEGFIEVRDFEGGSYKDDVTTYHLNELLTQIDSRRFSSIIGNIVSWFNKERNSLHNPFFISILAHTGKINKKDKNIIEKSILQQKRKSGLIDMYSAFLDGGTIFSTLWAVEILLALQEDNEYRNIIKDALRAIWNNWDDVHRSSFKGFFLELLLRFGKDEELPDPQIILNEIIKEQDKNGMWDNSYLYTFYIVNDLCSASDKYPETTKVIEKSLISLFNLKNKADSPPPFIKESLNKYAESLLIQVCIRSVIAADKYLKLIGYKDGFSIVLINELTGTWPKLYFYSNLLEIKVKKMLAQYGDIEREFEHIRKKTKKLFEISPYEKNVFIMMPLEPYIDGDGKYTALVKQIKNVLKKKGYTAWIATDTELDSTLLWNNVAAYLEACKYGIAIFTSKATEDKNEIVKEEYFNPNVSLEVGFMLARGKKVLLLKDKRLKKMTTDLVGHLYREFELNKPKQINKIIRRWIREVETREGKND